ncbi:Beta-galactosidase (Beta-gal) (Lactase) [Durusdinium trenchii]|uniref:beta-galactosidase n=1 Tax=Durusdinium trenchii TaxID=1381693 RepID=A0ABP0SGQ3_9DINO
MKSAYLRLVNRLRHLGTGALEHWQDPQVVYENVHEHHTPLRLLDNKLDAFAAFEQEKEETVFVRFVARVGDSRTCKFMLYPNPGAVPLAEVTARKCDDEVYFEDAEIPSVWQIEGNGDPPIYTNITFPWQRGWALSTSVPKRDNPTGVYRIAMDIPSGWIHAAQRGARDIFLILHGAGAGVDIFVNGHRIGYGQDSMTETEVVISDADLEEGTSNSLVLVVYRWTDGSYMEDQDQWWLSGVFRDIELQCRPREGGIADYIVSTSVQDSASAMVSADVRVTRADIASEDFEEVTVRAELYDADRKLVASNSAEAKHRAGFGDEFQEGGYFVAKVQLSVRDPHLWNVQDPYLYTLVLETTGSDGRVTQVEASQVGLRTVTITDAQVHVNGEPILVCGVNRHEWDPKRGKVILEETMIQDISLMKQFNFNAVRNSHYPNRHRWYELCDQMGLFVIDEANIETHGFSKVAHYSLLQNDWRWKQAFLARVKAMVKRSRNHACIIGWSLGNESGSGPNMRACADWVRRVDKSRTLQYEGGVKSGDSPMIMGDGRDPHCSDIICPMYDGPRHFAEVESETTAASGKYRKRPMILCEYSHAMGNSNGNLHQYWKLFRSPEHPRMQGGFIWDWVDQGLSRPDVMKGNWGYGGDFGPTSGREDSTFCINGLVFPDRTPHPAMHEAKYLMQPISFSYDPTKPAKVDVRLETHCVPLGKLKFEYRVYHSAQAAACLSGVCEVEPVDKPRRGHNARSGHAARDVDLQLVIPHTKLRQLWADELRGITLYVEATLTEDLAYAQRGHVVAHDSFLAYESVSDLRNSFETMLLEDDLSEAVDGGVRTSTGVKVVHVERGRHIRLESTRYTADFDIAVGRMGEVSAGDDILLEAGNGSVQHCFFRAATDNDLGGGDTMLPNELLKKFVPKSARAFSGFWDRMGLDRLEVVPMRIDVDARVDSDSRADRVVIRVFEEHRHGSNPRFKTDTTYTFTAESIFVDAAVFAAPSIWKGKIPSLPRVGLRMTVPGQFEQVEYFGQGPVESYPDRKAGCRMGVHQTEVDDMHVPYIQPSENGGRADVQWVQFTSRHTGKQFRMSYAFPEHDEVRPELFEGLDLSKTQAAPSRRPAGMFGAQFSASRYTPQEIHKAKHQIELPLRGKDSPIHVHLDTAHMGLGGDVSWFPKTQQQYRVIGAEWRYRVKIDPL